MEAGQASGHDGLVLVKVKRFRTTSRSSSRWTGNIREVSKQQW